MKKYRCKICGRSFTKAKGKGSIKTHCAAHKSHAHPNRKKNSGKTTKRKVSASSNTKSRHEVMVEAGMKSWITRRRNAISKKLFHKVYKELSSERQQNKVDAMLSEESIEDFQLRTEKIIDEGLSGKISAPEKVMVTEQLAVLATKLQINKYLKPGKKKWQFVEFLGDAGRESAGIVDLLAMRKNFDEKRNKKLGMKKGDSLEIIHIQVKGGTSGNPSSKDVKRMKKVTDHYRFEKTLLSRWITHLPTFFLLKKDDWVKVDPRTIFG